MNHIGTHDTERAFDRCSAANRVGKAAAASGSAHTLSRRRRETALSACVLPRFCSLCCGVPCIYYGDEAATWSGYRDPFNPACYRGDTKTRTLSHGTAASACCGRSTATFLKRGGLRCLRTRRFRLSAMETEGGEDALEIRCREPQHGKRGHSGCILTMQDLFSARRNPEPRGDFKLRRSASLCCASTAKKTENGES